MAKRAKKMIRPATQTFGGTEVMLGGTGEGRRFNYGFGGDNAAWNPYGTSGFGIGYTSVQANGRRGLPLGRVLSEDMELRQLPRRQMDTNHRDLYRNFSVAAWMIRQHLTYVSTFRFRAATGDRKLDQEIDDFHEWWSRPVNCDPGRRHSLQSLNRQWEMRRTVDGDVLLNKLRDGRVQTIEGDRIQSFGGIPFAEIGVDPVWVINGVYVDTAFAALKYMVFRRPPQWTGLIWDTAVDARFSNLFGYFDTRYDQVRGISPLASAANTCRDAYENLDYALIKAKVSQLFAMSIFRKNADQNGEMLPVQPPPYYQQNSNCPSPASGPSQNPNPYGPGSPYSEAFKSFGRGPVLLDMEPGDDAKILESEHPSEQFQHFMQIAIQITLKGLDLPYSFYDEAHSNFSGSRLAGINYENACKFRRMTNKENLDDLTEWRLRLAVMDGVLGIPQKILDRGKFWRYEHIGVPWYDPLKEVSAAVAAINAGIDSQISVAATHGKDAYQIIDERKALEDYARSQGVVLSTALANTLLDDPAKQRTQQEIEDVEDLDENKPDPGADDKKESGGGNGHYLVGLRNNRHHWD